MPAEALVSRLESVRRTSADRWVARCPSHDDRGPSLAVRELSDGRVLVHCFAGCSAHEVVSAAGLALSDLFPPRPLDSHATKAERRPFPAIDVLRCVAQEALIVAIAAMRLGRSEVIADGDRERLRVAAERICAAVDLAEGAL